MSTTSAARVLEKLGEAALKRFRVDGKWKKAPLSARQIAKLRKECLLLGGWVMPNAPPPYGVPRGLPARVPLPPLRWVSENLIALHRDVDSDRTRAREWPYEHVWPGTKKPVSQKKPKGHKWEAEKVERWVCCLLPGSLPDSSPR
eukprot:evm.model.scf_1432.1 EVM.evm.TU.scf_1432.1   scf_1432:2125-2990(+)